MILLVNQAGNRKLFKILADYIPLRMQVIQTRALKDSRPALSFGEESGNF
jgi:hypothetical protein